tara:strand:- start:1478 stop:1780 length:303 start_codon:yes stop_codon:yes gene_type:complete
MKFTKLFLIISLLVLTSCARQTFNISDERGELTEDKMVHFFVGGIGQEDTLNAAKICGGSAKVTQVESHLNPADALLGFFTQGLYAPKHGKVYCQTGESY